MTQEELDALLNSDMEDIAEGGEESANEALQEGLEKEEESILDPSIESGNVQAKDFKIDQDMSWPPPPPTAEHKVVHQLDDVTRETEIQATEMFDKLESINNLGADIEDAFKKIESFVCAQEELLKKLNAKFPTFHTFVEKLDEVVIAKENAQKISDALQQISMVSLEAMENLQYQDIHRQKIERVINVMRALSRYMSSLFEGKIDDSKRVGSAVHIQGDTTESVLDANDIEALIESFSK